MRLSYVVLRRPRIGTARKIGHKHNSSSSAFFRSCAIACDVRVVFVFLRIIIFGGGGF